MWTWQNAEYLITNAPGGGGKVCVKVVGGACGAVGSVLKLFRGGNKLKVRPKIDVHIDKDGLVHPLGKNGKPQGPSVNTDPNNQHVQAHGGAHPVGNLPNGLQAVPTGQPGHFVISPTTPMTLDQYQQLLDQIPLGNCP